jgi:L,D-transpeptidase YcfS
MIKKLLALLLVISGNSFINASIQKYTVCVCITSDLEKALECKKNILEENQLDVFILKDISGKYLTYLGIFGDENSAKYAMKSASSFVKKQRPFIKILPNETITNKAKNEVKKEPKKLLELVSTYPKLEELQLVESYPYSSGQKLDEEVESKNNQDKFKEDNSENVYTQEELKFVEEIKRISMEEFDNSIEEEKITQTPAQIEIKPKNIPIKPIIQEVTPKIEPKAQEEKSVEKVERIDRIDRIDRKAEKVENKFIEKAPELKKENIQKPIFSVSSYDEVLIEIDSTTNIMNLKAKVNNNYEEIKTYKVSTGKDEVKKPFGAGKVSKISLNPVWYPTADTIKSFKKRGINLPSVVPPGNKYNYMGAAKINLTHEVDGKNTFRIHGTLNEKTIGTNESAGCIRMKNGDVVQLATLLNQFANLKSLNDVKVILK